MEKNLTCVIQPFTLILTTKLIQPPIYLISRSRQTMKHNNSLINTLTRIQSHILRGSFYAILPKKGKRACKLLGNYARSLRWYISINSFFVVSCYAWEFNSISQNRKNIFFMCLWVESSSFKISQSWPDWSWTRVHFPDAAFYSAVSFSLVLSIFLINASCFVTSFIMCCRHTHCAAYPI